MATKNISIMTWTVKIKKNSFLLCLIILLFGAAPVSGKDKNPIPKLKAIRQSQRGVVITPLKKKDKWGFANKKGKFIIKPVFEDVKAFSNGVAVVKADGKWGIINAEGLYNLEPCYDMIEPFTYDYSIVKDGGLFGTINTKGELITDIDLHKIEEQDYFKNILYCRKNGRIGFIDRQTGELLVAPCYTSIDTENTPFAIVNYNGSYGLLDRNTHSVVAFKYTNIEYNREEEYYITEMDGKYGAVNYQGKTIINTILDNKPSLSDSTITIVNGSELWLATSRKAECFDVGCQLNYQNPRDFVLTYENVKKKTLSERVCLYVSNGKAAYVEVDGEAVWAANDDIWNVVSKPISYDASIDLFYFDSHYDDNSDEEIRINYYPELTIQYPSNCKDFRVPIDKIKQDLSKRIIDLYKANVTNGDPSVGEQVFGEYVNPFFMGKTNNNSIRLKLDRPKVRDDINMEWYYCGCNCNYIGTYGNIMQFRICCYESPGSNKPLSDFLFAAYDMLTGEYVSTDEMLSSKHRKAIEKILYYNDGVISHVSPNYYENYNFSDYSKLGCGYYFYILDGYLYNIFEICQGDFCVADGHPTFQFTFDEIGFNPYDLPYFDKMYNVKCNHQMNLLVLRANNQIPINEIFDHYLYEGASENIKSKLSIVFEPNDYLGLAIDNLHHIDTSNLFIGDYTTLLKIPDGYAEIPSCSITAESLLATCIPDTLLHGGTTRFVSDNGDEIIISKDSSRKNGYVLSKRGSKNDSSIIKIKLSDKDGCLATGNTNALQAYGVNSNIKDENSLYTLCYIPSMQAIFMASKEDIGTPYYNKFYKKVTRNK